MEKYFIVWIHLLDFTPRKAWEIVLRKRFCNLSPTIYSNGKLIFIFNYYKRQNFTQYYDFVLPSSYFKKATTKKLLTLRITSTRLIKFIKILFQGFMDCINYFNFYGRRSQYVWKTSESHLFGRFDDTRSRLLCVFNR